MRFETAPFPMAGIESIPYAEDDKTFASIMHSFSISLPNTARFPFGSEPRHAVARYKDHWASMAKDRTFLSRTCIADPTSVRDHQQQASVEEYTEFRPDFASG